MENKRTYTAPCAQLVLFAPREDISASFKIDPWWVNSAWWGLKAPENASVVTGTLGITDEDGNSWDFNGSLNK